jgi:hypothetical protein
MNSPLRSRKIFLVAAAVSVGLCVPSFGQESASVPQDLEIVYGFGATHAEWGRTTYRITADGVLTVEKTQGFGDAAKIERDRYVLTPDEIGQILRKIDETRFFRLKESYNNRRIMDGYSSFLSIRVNGKSHSVSVVNTSVKRYTHVAEVIEKLAAAKVQGKRESK